MPGPVSADERAAILDLFKDGPGSGAPSTYSGGQAWAADVAARRTAAKAGQLDALRASIASSEVSIDTRPGSIYVQSGDNLSKIAARFPEYGNTNDLKNQLIAANPWLSDPNMLREGMELKFPGAGTAVDSAAMARAVGADARYQAALSVQPEAQEPVWSFREASMAQRKLDDAQELQAFQARLASGPSMTAWDGRHPELKAMDPRRGTFHYGVAQGVADGIMLTAGPEAILGNLAVKGAVAALGATRVAGSGVASLFRTAEDAASTRAVVLGNGEAKFLVDDAAGQILRAEGTITGPHIGRAKGGLPEPLGGRLSGEHRGHLIPEGGVDNPSFVNRAENLISEAPSSNLGLKKSFDLQASRYAADNPQSLVTYVAEPQYHLGGTRPFAVTYYLKADGVPVRGLSIFNR